MTNYDVQKNPDYQELSDRIQALEQRLDSIESILRIEWPGSKLSSDEMQAISEKTSKTTDTESTIVENGLAWLGSVVLLFGIIFLMSYLDGLGFSILSRGIAYLSALGVIGFIYTQRNNFPILVSVMTICAPLLLFYITLSLHFFSTDPLIQSKGIELALLLSLIALQFVLATRKQKELLASLAVLMTASTAILMDGTYITFSLLALISLISLLFFYYKLWSGNLILTLFVVYLTHLLWLFNNPMMGNPMQAVAGPANNVLFLFFYGVVFTSSIFISKERLKTNGLLISVAIWNALLFTFLLFIILFTFYKDNYAIICLAIALFCIVLSVVLKLKSDRKFAPATYACFGFMALSMSVFGYAGLPYTYFLLALQSFLVVSMALWFRSKIIVVANSFLFITILLIYLTTAKSIDLINFTFAFTALATARILNLKKERLTLETEMFRNIFLALAFFMILYGLNQALPSQYVTLAWTACSIGFFVLSILLKNIKYRYLSILTIVVTGGHLFFVDLGQMEIGFRVVAFLVFAIISLAVSLYYTKRIHKSS